MNKSNSTGKLTIQGFQGNGWQDIGEVILRAPHQGLLGSMSFSYNPTYVVQVGGKSLLSDSGFMDERAMGVNVPGKLSGFYDERVIAPVLRDIIPHGFARQFLLEQWGLQRDPGPALDYRLLSQACVAPIGNLRVKEAAEQFSETVSLNEVPSLSKVDLGAGLQLMDFIRNQPVAIGALGAGGDSPKYLFVEDENECFYLEGTLPPGRVQRHWLVKLPRGRVTENDRNILRSEAAFHLALAECGFPSIQGAELIEEGRLPSLLLPRFDRSVAKCHERRFGVESMYSLNRQIGDGARMYHEDNLVNLRRIIANQKAFDEVLCDYLVRDVVNLTIGNTDNHGRNTAVIKSEGKIRLSPTYDLAPMALDDECIPRSTLWKKSQLNSDRYANYPAIINQYAHAPGPLLAEFKSKLGALSELGTIARNFGLPARVFNHSRINFKVPSVILRLMET